jgi:hypothetical protein
MGCAAGPSCEPRWGSRPEDPLQIPPDPRVSPGRYSRTCLVNASSGGAHVQASCEDPNHVLYHRTAVICHTIEVLAVCRGFPFVAATTSAHW